MQNKPLVILLVGGRSTRFWPLGEKPLLKFCGKTLFEHQLNLLKEAGLKDILVIGQKDNLPALKEIETNDLNLSFGEQKNLEGGMAAALLDTANQWQGKEILIVSANDVIETSGVKSLLETNTDGAVLAYKVSEYFPGGYLVIEENRIKAIKEKPTPGEEPSDLVNLVFHYHKGSTALLRELQNASSSKDDIYEVALTTLANKLNYTAVPYTGFWQALKYPWHALKLNDHFLGKLQPHISSSAQISETAVIKGDVIIEDGVKIFDHACVCGPAYLGKNVIVSNNALVRSSSLEENCVVGYNTEVARSLWQAGCETHINYTGDTVLAKKVSLGAGAITANYRLDGKNINSIIKSEKTDTQTNKFGAAIGENVHIGVHVTLSPGIKIGKNSLIASHILVDEDIEDGMFLYLKNGEKRLVENRLA